MVYVTLTFIITTIFTIAFIAKTYHWLAQQPLYSTWLKMPEPMVRTYNMETIFSSFIYTKDMDYLNKYRVGQERYMPADRVEFEKKRHAEGIGQNLLKMGFIETWERPYRHNPFINEVCFKVMVFKDGAVQEKQDTDSEYGYDYDPYLENMH